MSWLSAPGCVFITRWCKPDRTDTEMRIDDLHQQGMEGDGYHCKLITHTFIVKGRAAATRIRPHRSCSCRSLWYPGHCGTCRREVQYEDCTCTRLTQISPVYLRGGDEMCLRCGRGIKLTTPEGSWRRFQLLFGGLKPTEHRQSLTDEIFFLSDVFNCSYSHICGGGVSVCWFSLFDSCTVCIKATCWILGPASDSCVTVLTRLHQLPSVC